MGDATDSDFTSDLDAGEVAVQEDSTDEKGEVHHSAEYFVIMHIKELEKDVPETTEEEMLKERLANLKEKTRRLLRKLLLGRKLIARSLYDLVRRHATVPMEHRLLFGIGPTGTR